jgi:hypothetical protein
MYTRLVLVFLVSKYPAVIGALLALPV